MVPERFFELLLSKLGDADAVTIGLNVLGHDIHRDFAEEHVRADPRRRRDARRIEHIADQHAREVVGADTVGLEVAGGVDENFVY